MPYKRISGKVILDIRDFVLKQMKEAEADSESVKDGRTTDGCCIDNFAWGRRSAYNDVLDFLVKRLKL